MAGLEFPGRGGGGGPGGGRLGLEVLVYGGLGDAGGASPAGAGFCLGVTGVPCRKVNPKVTTVPKTQSQSKDKDKSPNVESNG